MSFLPLALRVPPDCASGSSAQSVARCSAHSQRRRRQSGHHYAFGNEEKFRSDRFSRHLGLVCVRQHRCFLAKEKFILCCVSKYSTTSPRLRLSDVGRRMAQYFDLIVREVVGDRCRNRCGSHPALPLRSESWKSRSLLSSVNLFVLFPLSVCRRGMKLCLELALRRRRNRPLFARSVVRFARKETRLAGADQILISSTFTVSVLCS